MKNITLVILVALFAFPSCAQKKEKDKDTSVYFLIRHAEKDQTDKTNRDPNLTEMGKQRAENWANHFKDLNLDAVYSTNYNRTRETAAPTAKANDLELKFYDPRDMKIEEFLTKTKGQTVLIVGHSNTTPMFANGLLGEEKYEDMSEDDNSSLFKVTVSKDAKTSEVLIIN